MPETKDPAPALQPEGPDMPDDEVLYELADLFRVFGDSTRIKILYALHDNELCVQDIANAVQLSQSAVSHQLRVLKDSKLVRSGGRARPCTTTGRRPCAQHPLHGDGPYRRMIFRAAARTKTERLVSTMKKTYKIEVDCANCAQKMEDAANTVAGVEKATVSFMTQKMKVEFAEGADPHATMENVLSACKKVEDDCEIFDI